jgi:hypothetical protein
MFYFAIVGVAAFVDGLAAGTWLGHKWGAAKIEIAVATAVKRATTIPAGGLATVVEEATAAVDKVVAAAETAAQVTTNVASTVATATDIKAKLNSLLAVAQAK